MVKAKPSVWLAATAGVALVAGIVAFLTMHSVSDADNWASIGGFLTALITVVVSGIAWVARRGEDPETPGVPSPGRSGWRLTIPWFNRNVFTGDHQNNTVYPSGDQRSSGLRRTKKRNPGDRRRRARPPERRADD